MWNTIISAFITGITVLVVAVPEGLPLAVAISLAVSVGEMQKDECLVKVLAACETMGNATTICSDKTGTLTTNRMTVVRTWISGLDFSQDKFVDGNGSVKERISEPVRKRIAEHIAFNRGADAFYVTTDKDGKALPVPTQNGNKTDCAIMLFSDSIFPTKCTDVAKAYTGVAPKVFPFNSGKKRSTCVFPLANGQFRVLVKGASEVVLELCDRRELPDGSVLALGEAEKAVYAFFHLHSSFLACGAHFAVFI